MLTLHDFMDSGNGYKVRLTLAHLGLPYRLVERRPGERERIVIVVRKLESRFLRGTLED